MSKIITPVNENKFKEFLTSGKVDTFKFKLVTTKDVLEVINSLKCKNSSGFDNISNNMVKIIKDLLSPALAVIINQSITTGTFPEKLKTAKVLPLFKKGDKNKLENYRPISLLPTISKIFEKVLFKQIYNYFDDEKILFQGQYGFRKGHSTELAAIELTDRITQVLDKGGIPFNIYLDLAKAFDTIDHDILLFKLKHYGFNDISLSLIRSYLNNRNQFVEIYQSRSTVKYLSCGVPQGSVLGPLFFIIYMNDLVTATNKFNVISYADDTTLIGNLKDFKLNRKSVNELAINRELRKIELWLCSNKLSLNTNKTKFMCFSTINKAFISPKLIIKKCLY